MSAAERAVEHVMCLGCGCGCDDITVRVRDNHIVAAERACPRGAAWFGDGVVPARARVGGRDVSMAEAVAAAARTLAGAARPLVYLTDDLSCEAQGECAAIADRLHAMLDALSTSTVLSSLLAAQRRGRAAATFGEIRNRGDVIVFWGLDPAARYPRYRERVAPAPAGAHVPDGRRSRTVIAVDVGDARGPDDADVHGDHRTAPAPVRHVRARRRGGHSRPVARIARRRVHAPEHEDVAAVADLAEGGGGAAAPLGGEQGRRHGGGGERVEHRAQPVGDGRALALRLAG